MYSLKGKVAIVTGGARDIGRQVSLKLAAAGAKVCINYFDNKEQADETFELIKEAGGEAIAVQGDMTKVCRCKKSGGCLYCGLWKCHSYTGECCRWINGKKTIG